MNFFGHAVVASWRSGEPGFVLGSMLPDFATMIGARVPPVTDAEVARGVHFHHETDRVFHGSPTFKALEARARRELRALELPRPSALAVAHIGVEILLDGALADDRRACDRYTVALASGHRAALGAHIDWGDVAAAARYEELCGVLSARGVASGAVAPEMVAWRIARALSRRPRFRLDADGERTVRTWTERTLPEVAAARDAIVSELREGLGLART